MAVERVRVHIPQEEKFEKGGCRLSGSLQVSTAINLTKKVNIHRWQWDVLIRDIGVYDVIPGSELSCI